MEFPLGVNQRLFKEISDRVVQSSQKIGNDFNLLIYIGKMDKTRRLSEMIEAFRLVADQFDQCRLLMIGDGDDRPQLQDLTKRIGLTERVLFTGNVPYDAIPAYLSAADIGLAYIPQTNTYNFQPSLKTLEYRQVGLPQVATATAANRVTVQHGKDGLISNDDAAGYAAAIIELMENQELYRHIQKCCKENIDEFFWDNLVKRILIPYYQSIVGIGC